MNTYRTKVLMLTLIALWLGIFGLSPSYALSLSEAQKLLASDGGGADNLGWSVSIDGDTAVVGAWNDANNGNRSGSAFIYVRDSAGMWREQQKLYAIDGVADDRFGRSVALYGDTVVIGAQFDDDKGADSGSAYVYVRDGAGVWHEQQKLNASDGAALDNFGWSVSIAGETAVIGASSAEFNPAAPGSAYVFVRDGAGLWHEQQKLTASDGAAGDAFGYSVSISGNTAVIGAERDDDHRTDFGSAYVFTRDGAGLWHEQQKLTASDGAALDYFGSSVSLSGETVMIGAHFDDDNGEYSGSVYVFVRDGAGVWHEKQKLTASDGARWDEFGWSVSISSDMAVIGAFRDTDNGFNSGSAYVYLRDDSGVWNELQKLGASDGAANDFFGRSVSIAGDTVVIGALGNDDKGSESGSAYVFEVSDLEIEKFINHRVRETPGTAAQLLVGTRYRAEYKVTNNSPNRLYRVRVFEGGQLVCNLYDMMPGQSKQPGSCANSRNVLAGLHNVPANVSAKVSGSNQTLSGQANAYYVGFGNQPGKLSVTHYVNNKNADTQGSAASVIGNQAEITFRVENTGSIKLYRVKTYHDPVSPIDSGWQQQCFFGTLNPGQVRYCKRTINVNHSGLNKAFGRAQGEDANVNPTGFVNASNPTYFNVVLP